jgi:carbon-monoxide dehydrogenase medium subunit
MTPFELLEPASLREAIALLDPDDPATRPISGGTALMLMMKAGVFKPRRLVSLRSVEHRFSRIEPGDHGELHIGALAPLSTLEHSPAIRIGFPVIARTLRTLSNVRVRNVATIGGHLAHGDPCMDLPPVLSALGARVVIAGPSGERTVDVEKLYVGYYETVLDRNEIISELIIPAQTGRRAVYLKCTTRSSDDWPALGVAVSLDAEGTVVREASVVVSAATSKPTRLTATEALLRGADVDESMLIRAGVTAADEVTVVADVRGSAAYKKQLVRVYITRAIRAALAASAVSGPAS